MTFHTYPSFDVPFMTKVLDLGPIWVLFKIDTFLGLGDSKGFEVIEAQGVPISIDLID